MKSFSAQTDFFSCAELGLFWGGGVFFLQGLLSPDGVKSKTAASVVPRKPCQIFTASVDSDSLTDAGDVKRI